MSDSTPDSLPDVGASSGAAPATPAPVTPASSTTKPQRQPARPPRQPLPRWKVLLHNDDKNDFAFVIESVQMITHLTEEDAQLRADEAHRTGVSLLLTTHQELAELYQQQFTSRNLTVTIEPETP